MSGFILHESLYRTPDAMARLKDFPVTICGAGALGANIVEGLVRVGCEKVRVIDRDRVEEQNLSTQPYHRSDIGSQKAKILANTLYRAVGVKVDARAEELTAANAAKLLEASALVVDAFDNSTSRQAVKDTCAAEAIPCLHTGLASDYAEMIWNETYKVPSGANDDVCDYPLARNLVMVAAAVTTEIAIRFALSGLRGSYTFTFEDLSLRPYVE